MFWTILAFAATIGVLVLIHELGHFLVAKKFNIKVLEFGFGLPPRLWGKKIGETIFSLNWLPFGGFVHLLGEDESDKTVLKDSRSFASQAVWKRIAVVTAGVIMNLLLAWLLYYIVLAAQGFRVELPLLTQHKFVGVYQNDENVVLISNVAENSPAQAAGIKSGDRVIAFNDQFIHSSDELIDDTKANLDKPIKLTVSDARRTEYRTVELTPRSNPPEGQGALGVSLSGFQVANLEYRDTWQRLLSGPIHGYNLASYSFEVLGNTISSSLAKRDFQQVSQTVAGPVGITAIVGEILKVDNPMIPFLDFVAALSLNLAVVNILPFPGLDGGRLLFLVIEAVTRKKTHPVVEKYVHSIGLAILLTFIILVTVSDVKKIFF